MKIMLMRHGEAVPFAANDADRPLTPTGCGEATRVGHRLKEAGFIPSVIAHSTRRRAKQTATLINEAFGEALTLSEWAGITPEDSWKDALQTIEKSAEDGHLIVFHQPILAQIVGFLLEGDPQFDIHPRTVTGTVYVLDCEHMLAGSARLIAAYTPLD